MVGGQAKPVYDEQVAVWVAVDVCNVTANVERVDLDSHCRHQVVLHVHGLWCGQHRLWEGKRNISVTIVLYAFTTFLCSLNDQRNAILYIYKYCTL